MPLLGQEVCDSMPSPYQTPILSLYLTTELLQRWTPSLPLQTPLIYLLVHSEDAFWGPSATQASDFPMIGTQFPESKVT